MVDITWPRLVAGTLTIKFQPWREITQLILCLMRLSSDSTKQLLQLSAMRQTLRSTPTVQSRKTNRQQQMLRPQPIATRTKKLKRTLKLNRITKSRSTMTIYQAATPTPPATLRVLSMMKTRYTPSDRSFMRWPLSFTSSSRISATFESPRASALFH
jgi:hypothetical protein